MRSPSESSAFKYPEGHSNPIMTESQAYASVSNGAIANYLVSVSGLQLPEEEQLVLTQDNTIEANGFKVVPGNYLFKGAGSLATPELGDIRIALKTLPNPLTGVTVFGQMTVASKTISNFTNEDASLFRATKGDKAAGVTQMHTEFTFLTWILRVVGFVMMYLGLAMMLGPISTLLDVLPFLGSVSRFAVTIVAAVVLIATVTVIKKKAGKMKTAK